MELFTCKKQSSFDFFQPLKKIKTIANSRAEQKQVACPGRCGSVGRSFNSWLGHVWEAIDDFSLSVSLSLSPFFTKSISIFFKFLKEKQKQVAIGFGHGSPAPLLWDRWLQGQLVETLFPVKPLQRPYLNLSFAISSQIQNDGSLLTEVTSHTRTKRRGGWRLSWC